MRFLLIDLLLVFYTVSLSFFIFLAALLLPKSNLADRIGRYMAQKLVDCTQTDVIPSSIPLPDKGPYIIMANHQSYLDPLILVAESPIPLRGIGKIEVLFIPVFGLALWAMGNILINRQNHEKAVASLKKAADKIRAGTTVFIFPEGTRSSLPNEELLPFKKGGFMMALAAGVPIVPIGISGTAQVWPKGLAKITPGTVAYEIGEPIPTQGLTAQDRDMLMDKVRAAIENLRDQAKTKRDNVQGK